MITIPTRSPIDAQVSLAAVRVLKPCLPASDALLPYLRTIDESRTYSNYGPLSRDFARRLGELTGAAGVTLTSNGTTAIELALRASVPPGGICMMPAFTFIASAHAVCNAGLTPFLVEVDPEALVLTPAIAEAALVTAPARPAAIVVVSAFGAPPDTAGWAAFRTRHGIPVVFDAAAAVTAINNSVGVEPLCVSLHATKVLGIGEGGAILTNDSGFTARTTAMTGFGFLGAARVSEIRGGNFRVSEYAAAIGLAALDALPARLARLRSLAAHYRALLAGKASRLQEGAGERWATMTLNVILPAGEEAATTARLDAAAVEWRRWWGFGCHRHPAFADVPRAELCTTDALAPRVLGVPFHDDLTAEEIERVVDSLP